MRALFAVLIVTVLLSVTGSVAGAEPPLPIIDAHSQAEKDMPLGRIIELMDEAQVARTLLAARHGRDVGSMVRLARNQPDRITALVRTKSKHYQKKAPEAFQAYLDKQTKHPEFAGIAETLMFHAQKRDKKGRVMADEVAFPPGHVKVDMALTLALEKAWPFIIHIEFVSTGDAHGEYMAKMEAMLDAHPGHPFLLIHMGQLQAGEVGRLIDAHPNLHFIPAHTTPITVNHSREPWTNMFKGESLAPEWKRLFISHPDRFVLGFDNVWVNHWKNFYIPQVKLWRKALGELPGEVAHAVAHRNAEKLWNLPPLR